MNIQFITQSLFSICYILYLNSKLEIFKEKKRKTGIFHNFYKIVYLNFYFLDFLLNNVPKSYTISILMDNY